MTERRFDRVATQAVRAMLWAAGIFGLVMIFGSMLAQMYGMPPPSRGATPLGTRWCVGSLLRLQVQLEEHAATVLQNASQDDEAARRWQRFYDRWRQDAHALADGCDGGDAEVRGAMVALGGLGETYDAAVSQVTRTAAPLRERMEEAVGPRRSN